MQLKKFDKLTQVLTLIYHGLNVTDNCAERDGEADDDDDGSSVDGDVEALSSDDSDSATTDEFDDDE